jgi:hypothetical protein
MASTLLADNGVSSGAAGLKSSADGTGTLALQTTTASGTATTAVLIDNAQNVGVGVTPAAKFNIGAGGAARFNRSDNATYGEVAYGGAGVGMKYSDANSDGHRFFNGATQAMTLDTSGRLGIGSTSTPAAYQNINGYFQNGRSGWAYVVDDSANTHIVHNIIFNGTNNTYAGTGYASRMSIADADGSFRWYQAGSGTAGGTATLAERARIDSSGNLLVGTTSSLTSGRSAFWSSTAVPAAEFRVNAASSDSTQAISIVKNSTTNTTAQVIANFTINSGGTGAGQINCNGASQAAFGSFSDSRLKENIVDLPSQLSNIMALRPVEFDYIESEGGGHQIGFIAQEMQTVYPDAIGERQPDNMLSITGWSKTEARLVKAIQELKAELDTAKEQIAALQGAAK